MVSQIIPVGDWVFASDMACFSIYQKVHPLHLGLTLAAGHVMDDGWLLLCIISHARHTVVKSDFIQKQVILGLFAGVLFGHKTNPINIIRRYMLCDRCYNLLMLHKKFQLI